MSKTGNKELAAALSEKHGLTKQDAEKFVAAMFDVLGDGLSREKQVKVKGLGTFKVVSVAARKSVDVNTGEPIVIEGRDKINFTPDSSMRDEVNKPFSQFETVVVNDGVDFSEIDEKFDEEQEEEKANQQKKEPQSQNVDEQQEPAEEKQEPADEKQEPADEKQEPVEEQHLLIEEKQETVADHSSEKEQKQEIEPEQSVGTETLYEEEPEQQTEAVTPHEEDSEQSAEAEKPHEEKPEQPAEAEKPHEEEPEQPAEAETLHEEESEQPAEDEPVESQESIGAIDAIGAIDTDHRSSSTIKYLLVAVLVLLIICVAGVAYMFIEVQKRDNRIAYLETLITNTVTPKKTVKKPVASKPADPIATANAAEEKLRKAEEAKPTAKEEKAEPKVEKTVATKKEKAEQADKEDVSSKYDKDPRIRTGAYRITGVAKTVKVKSGQTLAGISRSQLGPGMECYIEAVNGGRTEFKAGEKINIPSLKLKKRTR